MVNIKLIVDGVTVHTNNYYDAPVEPITDTGFYKPSNETELAQFIRDAISDGYVGHLDPQTEIEISKTIAIDLPDVGGNPVGISGSYARLVSQINDGSDIIRITGAGNNRCLVFQGLSIYGGGYEGRNSGAGLRVIGPKGKAIYKATFRDIYVSYCDIGMAFEGDVFESLGDNLHAKNNRHDGISLSHGADGGILSNFMLRAVNLSRNSGYGLRLNRCTSVDVLQGSFVNNALGGIIASNGIRTVDSVNCENTGEIGIDVATSDYQTRIVGCEASTDGATHAQGGKALQYLFRYKGNDSNLRQSDNRITYYGSGTFNGSLRAP